MSELLIWIAGFVFNAGAFALGWYCRGRFYRHPTQQQIGVRVCATCGEPVPKGTPRQANGQVRHPHCKGIA